MWVTVVWQSAGLLTGFISTFCTGFLEAIFFGGISYYILLSLDIVRGALDLPQSNVLDIVGSPWEALPSLRSGWEWSGEKAREWEERKERLLGLL